MNYILLKDLTKYVADKTLFEGISLGMNQGQKFALIARNGTGKTTLLNIIAGRDVPTEGEAIIHPGIRIGYLDQDPKFEPGHMVLDALFADRRNPVAMAVKAYEAALEHHDGAEIQRTMEQMDHHRAWDYEAQVKQVMGKLKIDHLDQSVESLSGGQRKRLALARVLLQQPDLLILDEPTNHLDIDMIEWLEEYLQQPGITLLLVTHDRYFLENICDELVELDHGTLIQYKGNYSYYLSKKADLEHNRTQAVEKARSMVRQEIDWIRRMPKARGTKNKARVDAFHDWKKQAGVSLEKEEVSFKMEAARLGSKVLELKSVCKAYGDNVLLDKFTYSFKRFEKAGIVGPNGTGKTTLLRLITGEVLPDSGTIKLGDTIQVGYFSQENPPDCTGKRVIDIVREVANEIPLQNGHSMNASQFLQLFQFPPPQQWHYYETLSGGEKRRLHLVTTLIGNPNFLILDEPTNDLDIPTLQTLENFLQDFSGCVLIVSHDRFFMDRIVDHLFVFKGKGEVIDFPGNYSQYRLWEEMQSSPEITASKTQAAPTSKKADKPRKRLGYMEQREFDQLGKELAKLEHRKTELASLLESGESDYAKLQAWGDELTGITRKISEKEDRWLELSEFVEG